jgi:hypothetical protein
MKVEHFFGIGFGGIIFLGICMMLLGSYFTRHSESYLVAANHIEKNANILEMTGGIESFGWFPSAEIVTYSNGIGSWAEFTLTVDGKEHDIWLKISLETDSVGEWKVISCNPNYRNTEGLSLTKLMRGN